MCNACPCRGTAHPNGRGTAHPNGRGTAHPNGRGNIFAPACAFPAGRAALTGESGQQRSLELNPDGLVQICTAVFHGYVFRKCGELESLEWAIGGRGVEGQVRLHCISGG